MKIAHDFYRQETRQEYQKYEQFMHIRKGVMKYCLNKKKTTNTVSCRIYKNSIWQTILKILLECTGREKEFPKFEKKNPAQYNTVCPIWIWLTLIAYYEEANYISALLMAELCMIFPYILIFEKNFWFGDGWFFTLKS